MGRARGRHLSAPTPRRATETGSTLRAIAFASSTGDGGTLTDSTAMQCARVRENRKHALLLRAAIEAQSRVGIMLNVRNEDLESVLALLPALQRPTISPLSEDGWVAVNTIIEERTVRDLIPKLKSARAQGIVEYPLNKIVV